MNQELLYKKIDDLFKVQNKAQSWGFAQLNKPLSLSLYKNWLDENHQATMSYLARHLPQKENPQLLESKVQSAIVGLFNYIPHPQPIENPPLSFQKVAKYARGNDYHHWLKTALEEICIQLRREYPEELFIAMTDNKPVLERDLAYRAGLGWIGKNTNLIHKKWGSFFLIGEIYTSLYLENQSSLSVDHCGSCNRCIEACPTQALSNESRKLDANLCISYWTIESKDLYPPKELRSQFSGQLFGCDICQSVCPWNKAFDYEKTTNLETLTQDLKWLLTASDQEIRRAFKDSALERTKPNGLRRNALITIENLKLKSLKNEVSKWTLNIELKDLAEWTLQSLSESTQP